MSTLHRLSVYAGLMLASTLLLAGCSERQTPAGAASSGVALPIEDPGEAILIVFENDPRAAEGQCEPVLKLAMKSDNDSQRLRYHALLDGQPYLQMVVAKTRSDAGFGYAQQKLASHQPIDKPCADISIELKELRCANPPGYYLEDCGRELRLQADGFASASDTRE